MATKGDASINIADQLARMEELVLSQARTIQQLQEHIEYLKKQLYGPRSEKIQSDHPQLPFDVGETTPDENEGAVADDEGAKPKRERRKAPHGRKPLPDHLPRERIEHLPEAEQLTCACGKDKKRCGEDVTEELEYIPASLKVIEHVRPRFACASCQEKPVQRAALARPIAKGRPGPGLLAHVAVSKYGDHLPLNRLSQIFEREGVHISRSTLADWIADSFDLLQPVLKGLKNSILQSDVIGNDDTKVVMQLNHRSGGRKTCYLWSSVGDRNEVYFDFTTGRGREGPTKFFGGYTGTVVVDGYAGYNELFAKGKATEAGCWAHARRYFHRALSTHPLQADEMVHLIKKLYKIETDLKGESVEKKHEVRQEKSVELVEGIFAQMEEWRSDVLPQSALGKAIQYALNRKDALEVYLEDGRVPIDNNATERTIRAIALGRKNWLFTGSVEGGKRAAGMYSLVQTCKLHGVEPWAYLYDVFSKAPTLSDEELARLTPRLWKEARDQG